MRDTAQILNDGLRGYTSVFSLALTLNALEDQYQLSIELANDQGQRILLACADVSAFTVKEIGGGLGQFLLLRATDIRSHQLDRKYLHFEELERKAVSFDCTSAGIQRLSTDQPNLIKVATGDSGWSTLFRDITGAFIERTYPQGQMHGGGPPKFAPITEEEARRKYTLI